MKPAEDTPLLEVFQLGLDKYLDDLAEVSSQASKEFALEKVKLRVARITHSHVCCINSSTC